MNTDQVLKLLQDHPLLDDGRFYPYGTAGFRFKVECMDGILLRVGIVSAILLQQQQQHHQQEHQQAKQHFKHFKH